MKVNDLIESKWEAAFKDIIAENNLLNFEEKIKKELKARAFECYDLWDLTMLLYRIIEEKLYLY